MNNILIGKRIVLIMKIRNIKRRELANKLGVSYNTLTKKIKGRRQFNLDEICKLKDILNIDNELMVQILFSGKFYVEFDNKESYEC